jgi:uncharacterized RDD family membrane protein YckC
VRGRRLQVSAHGSDAMRSRSLGPLERLPQAIAEQVVRRIVEVLDVDEIVRRIDVDDIVRRIDVNAVMARVDVDDVVRRVDPNELLERVDIDRIVERIDVNAIAEKIDVDELVRRADLGPLIAQSTTGMLGEFLVLLRRQVVTLDDLLDAVFLRNRRTRTTTGPANLIAAASKLHHPNREGRYAGGATRLLALLADIAAGWGIFIALVTGLDVAVGLFSSSFSLWHHHVVAIVASVVWGFVYFTAQWMLSGRTIGMAVLGARVVTIDGHSLTPRPAAVRALVLPISIAVVVAGLIGIFVRDDRRALHDLAAGTCVVYNWQARSAATPWHHQGEVPSSVP